MNNKRKWKKKVLPNWQNRFYENMGIGTPKRTFSLLLLLSVFIILTSDNSFFVIIVSIYPSPFLYVYYLK